jgi:hypothetical protein
MRQEPDAGSSLDASSSAADTAIHSMVGADRGGDSSREIIINFLLLFIVRAVF